MTVYEAIRSYISEYEFRFDEGGGHVPTDAEKAMLEDFANGLIADDLFIKALARIAPAEVSDKRQDYTVADEYPQLSREQIDDMNSGD